MYDYLMLITLRELNTMKKFAESVADSPAKLLRILENFPFHSDFDKVLALLSLS